MVQTVDNQAGHIRGVVGVGVSIGEKEASELRLLRWAVLEVVANATAGVTSQNLHLLKIGLK